MVLAKWYFDHRDIVKLIKHTHTFLDYCEFLCWTLKPNILSLCEFHPTPSK